MNLVSLFKVAILLSAGFFILPKKYKITWSVLLHLVIAITTTVWAIKAWGGSEPMVVDLGIPFWGGTPSFVIDKLSAFFVVIINVTSLTGIIYGAGYLKPYFESKGPVSMSLHVWAFLVLHVSMLHVVMMREGFAFLMAWEVMSMCSFLLVIFEGEKADNLKTGINYLVQMHAGFTCLLLGFLWISKATGIFGFDGLAPYFIEYTNWGIFLILFAGFAVKAGFVPLHTWLPHAHPAAPSHVSGVMSGVMIKMGIYGILRVLTYVQDDFLIIGIVVLSISIATGIAGIVYASFQKDLKKLLAYSSIENIGIIGIGLGVALLGRHLHNDILITLGMTGALLHVLNHSLYKSMLFYTAGNVYYSTHTRDLNKLGGIIKLMPISGMFFIVGSLAICAIPPFNGFISEYLIYKSAFLSFGTADLKISMMILIIILSLVLIGGLSVYTFTKAFGITFLGSRRDPHAHVVVEVPGIMRVSGIVIMTAILFIALFSPWVVNQVGQIGKVFPQLDYSDNVLQSTVSGLQSISFINLLILVVVGGIFLMRLFVQRKAGINHGPTWGCGYSAGDYKHQYTSTSYSDYLRQLAGPAMKVSDQYFPFEESEIFPGERSFKTETKDLVEEEIIIKPVESAVRRLMTVGWAQTGKINHYLVYPVAFLILIGLLTMFGVL